MSDLSPRLHQLVLAGRVAQEPTAHDFQRVLGALTRDLGDTAFDGLPGLAARALPQPPLGMPVRTLSVKLAGLFLVGIALVSAGWVWESSASKVVPPVAEQQRASVGTAERAPAVVATEGAGKSPSVTQASPVEPPDEGAVGVRTVGNPSVTRPLPGKASPGPDTLAAEVSLLSRAESALSRGRPQLALTLLEEHKRRFEHGILADERTTVRVQALCALGQTAEANAQRATLKAGSLHANLPSVPCDANAARAR